MRGECRRWTCGRWFCAAVRRTGGFRRRARPRRPPRWTPRSAGSVTRCASNYMGIVADVTVHDVLPVRRPARVRLSAARGRAIRCTAPDVTVHVDQGAQPVRDRPRRSRFQRRHPDRRRLRATQHRRPRRAAVRAAERAAGRDGQRRRVVGRLPRPGDQRGAVDTKTGTTSRSGTCSRPLRAVDVAATAEADLPELADVAARTFPLACPPSVTPENIAAFIDAEPLAGAFRATISTDPDRVVLAAREDGRIDRATPC